MQSMHNQAVHNGGCKIAITIYNIYTIYNYAWSKKQHVLMEIIINDITHLIIHR